MVNPTINQLIDNNEDINRYSLVIAAAKSARIITDEYIKQKEYAEKIASLDGDKKGNYSCIIKKEYRDEKAVKNAVNGLYEGEFEIVKPDGTRELIGKLAQAKEADAE